ncbi:MAG: caspase family protein [Leptolyngbya sp. Prado105]|nr:caspase family protein [Leptolyngbya sp. Prado105]
MAEFSRNLAIVIGINDYRNGIAPLQTAVNDARQLVKVLQEKHEYQVWLYLDAIATLKNLKDLLETTLPQTVTQDDRLLFYFAGHGIALNSDNEPAGYLIPQDAKQGEVQTYLPMTDLKAALEQLPCRHFLGILDCCFAGAFRWGSTRDLFVAPEVIHLERYYRFTQDPAWQIITSAASDQKALDAFALNPAREKLGEHSPFADALIKALSGDADCYPPATFGKRAGDGVVTATELYLYLRDRVELATESHRQRQTPGLCSLKKHDKGEYIFLTPGHPLNLPPAPPLDESKNPYRGLASFEAEHKALFFGRTESVEHLEKFVTSHPLTVVLGASGSGKSSLVKAGLIPKLEAAKWRSIVIRPGKSAYAALNIALQQEITAQKSYVDLIADWKRDNPDIKILLVIDQCEELITLCQNEQDSHSFLDELEQVIAEHSGTMRVILTLRSDFEPQLRDLALKDRWAAARFIVPAMSRSQLRDVIEKPAEARVMYFHPNELVEQLIDEVADMPGALPLLSFALSELYLKYLKRQHHAHLRGETLDRAITQADYDELGGVTRSLTQRADQECDALGEAYEQTIKLVMLRMVAIGGGELARRRVSWAELIYPPARAKQVKAVTAQFSAARLLVEGQDAEGNCYVEPAHDALIQGWAKLRNWATAEKNLDLQRRLTPAAFEWKTKQQKRFLWNADPYLEVLQKEILNSSDQNWLNQVETEFVQCSIQQRQRNVRIRWGIATATMLGLGSLTIWALMGQREATIGQMQAASQASEALLQGKQPTVEALLGSLRAGNQLQALQRGFLPMDVSQFSQVVRNLRKAVYTVRETNRLTGFSGRVAKVFWKDGRLLVVTVAQNGTVQIWDRRNEQEIELPRPGQATDSVQLSPDGDRLAIAAPNGTISLWRWQQQQVSDLKGQPNPSLRFSPDSRQLVSVGEGRIDVWDLTTNSHQQLTQPNLLDAGFDNQGQLLRVITTEGTVKVLDASGKPSKFNLKIPRPPRKVTFSPDGNQIVLDLQQPEEITEEGAILWNWKTGETTSLGQDLTVAFNPDGSQLATTGSDDGIVRLRDASNTSIEFKAHQTQVANLDFREDGSQLATASADGTVRIWSVQPQPLQFVKQLPGSFRSVAFQPGSNQILGQSTDGVLHWFDQGGHSINQPQLFSIPFNEIRFRPNHQQWVAVAQDGTLHLRSSDGKLLRKFEGVYSSSSNVAFSPDGLQFAVIAPERSNSKAIRILDIVSGEVVKSLPVTKQSNFDQVIWKPDGQILYATLVQMTDGVRDNSIRLWDAESNQQYATPLTARRNSLSSLTFNQDGSMSAIAEREQINLTYLDGTTMTQFSADSGQIKSLKLSSDGTLLLSIGDNGTAKLWRIGGLDHLIAQGCDLIRNYLTQRSVSQSDRDLCKN